MSSEPVDRVMQVAARLAALPEPAMRVAGLVDELGSSGDLRAVWTLEWIIRGALYKEAACVSVYDCLLDPEEVMGLLGERRLLALLDAGRDEGCVGALQWLLSCSELPLEERTPSDRLIDKELRQLTLGDRRALARRATGEMLNRLGVDPDPGVISNLLNNPRITEQHVLAIASRRPTVPQALVAVLRSPKWLRRQRVKIALVKNPALEHKFAVNLLVYLSQIDLRDIRDDETLSSALRLAAQRLLDLPPLSFETEQVMH